MTDEPTHLPVAAPVSALAPSDGKEPCPECGLRYIPGAGMGVHRRSAHGVANRKRRPKANPPTSSTSAHGPGRPPKIDLTVDDVFDVVVSQMFPRGSIPVAALTPLLRWRHATDEMLSEVLNGGQR